MVQGGAGSTGATKTGNNERFARERFATAIVNLAKRNKGVGLDRVVSDLLLQSPDLQKLNSHNQTTGKVKFSKKQTIELLRQNPEFLKATDEYLQANPNEQKQLIEELSKDPTVIQKVNSLGKTLAIGAGLAVAAPFIGIGIGVLAAIALICFAVYKREAISKGIGNATKYAGKKVTHLLKNLIDKLPFRSSNAVSYLAELEHDYVQAGYDKATDNLLPDDAVFIKKYFLNEDGFKALEEQIKNSDGKRITVKGEENEEVALTLKDLKVLKEKGDSTLAKADDDKFKEKLGKFKLIMSEANKEIRAQVETRVDEAEQDKAHREQKLQTPATSSALCSFDGKY
ncbi:hypothetical protein [Wolbachia endosymbiont (group E) of Neria commutata]|uniref:hypothetical protein n=1 Tax=Wolbachia endosymbiont (group E) of Neria commutata TaxID=3066149 RepID=UPI0031330105